MAFYDQAYPSWSGPSRTSPFENRPNLPKLDEHYVYAFNHQLEEVEKAIDNLVKSGKLYANVQSTPATAPVAQVTRRDSVPTTSIPRSPLDTNDVRMAQTMPSRHYSIHSMDNVRTSQSYANLHSYYANQRAGQRTPDDDGQLMQLKRRVALQRDIKTLPSEYSSNGTSNATSASSSLILDTSITGSDPIHSPLTLSEAMDDSYSNRRRRFRLGSSSYEALSGINEADLTPRAGPQTAGVIGMQQGNRTSPTASYDPFSNEFGQVTREPKDHDRRLREQRSRTDSNPAESPSPRSATFSLFSSESTQTNTTTASSPESSPLKTSKPSLPASKIAPIGTKRSSGSLASNDSDNARVIQPPVSAPAPSPLTTTPGNDTDKWNVFSGGWGTPFGGDNYHPRSATTDSTSQKTIWGSNPKGLGMSVGSGSVDVWG